MFDVFYTLGTLPSRRDKLKSSMISINEFLGLLVKAFNSDLLTVSFLEVSSYFLPSLIKLTMFGGRLVFWSIVSELSVIFII
ncbi:hypothetical protein BpHYR1_053344 [Brachionus plicatilis]|uniref:Uncharacterized protein n=1 Tax=Brachionus plicatilis TaxID=10195 RepID=A0A3M7QEK6_BRAPC|nr:hypothetical protein BpHYR1_053344 [Brachionus plicatilis]